MVKIGKVVDTDGNKVRVHFPETQIVSDWLSVVQRGEEWMPSIGSIVLCLFDDTFNGDGYVIGGLA